MLSLIAVISLLSFFEELIKFTINDKLSGCKLNYIIPYLCENYMRTLVGLETSFCLNLKMIVLSQINFCSRLFDVQF